jgi:folate-binding protein YgfZ
MIPAVSVDAYQAARHHVASIDRSDRGRIVISGADRASYLQGLLTNDIAALEGGRGCYTAYLTPQGRMIADLFVYELGDVMLLTMARDVRDTVVSKFDQFIFTEDVQLGDVTETFAQIAVVGPDAVDVLTKVVEGVDLARLTALAEHGNVRAQFGGQPAIVTRVTDTGEPGFDVYLDCARAAAFRDALAAHGVAVLDEETAEALRIEAGVPRFHRDLDEETIPLEAGIESRAISFTKGCYVGQEVIIRVLHRGHGRVARKLVGLVLDGSAAPAAGTAITAAAREIGRVTSSTLSPAFGTPIALGYVHRDFLAPGTVVSIADVRAVVTALPFSLPAPGPPEPAAE